jgi:hypothetical protein
MPIRFTPKATTRKGWHRRTVGLFSNMYGVPFPSRRTGKRGPPASAPPAGSGVVGKAKRALMLGNATAGGFGCQPDRHGTNKTVFSRKEPA